MNALSISRPFLTPRRLWRCCCDAGGLGCRHSAFASAKLAKLVIVGAAPEGARLIDLCRIQGIEVLAVCDGNAAKHGTNFSGHTIRPVVDALVWGPDTPIVIASHKPLAAVKELQALGARMLAPFALLQVLHPQMFPPHMFYAGWLEDLCDNRAHYVALQSSGWDVLSLWTLDAIIGFVGR